MSVLSAIELEMREACRLALSYLTQKLVNRKEYLFLMETLRNAVRRADLKESGCPTGTHSSDCTCSPGRVGRSVHAIKYRAARQRGYTLIELLIVVCIIGVLAGVLIPIAGSAIARAKLGTTLGNLAALRVALATYTADTEGKYPAFPASILTSTSSTGGYGTVLHDALVPAYIDKIPVAYVDSAHPANNWDCDSWNMLSSCENTGTGYGSGWMYDANPWDVGVYPSSGWGAIRIACQHTNIKGIRWSSY